MRQRRPATDAPERLEPAARERVRAWAASHHPELEPHLGRHWHECRDWHLANGVQRCDWEAALRMWLRKAIEFEQRREPREIRGRRRGAAEPDALADVIQLFQKEKS